MDQETLVRSGKIDQGWRLLVQLVRDGVDVAGAAWVSTDAESPWQLYVYSNVVDVGGPLEGYKKISSALDRIPRNSLSISEIKMVSPRSSIGEELAFVNRRYGRYLWSGGPSLGDTPIDWAYHYPPSIGQAAGSAPLTQDEVRRKVLDLLDQTGPLPPATVTLQDGTQFFGVPCGVEVSNQKMTVKFFEDPHRSTTVPLSEIVSVR